MNIQFTHPMYLLLLPPALVWVIWLAWKSDVQISRWRRWVAFALRTAIVLMLILALAGLQWLRSREGHERLFPSRPFGQHSLETAGGGEGFREPDVRGEKDRRRGGVDCVRDGRQH